MPQIFRNDIKISSTLIAVTFKSTTRAHTVIRQPLYLIEDLLKFLIFVQFGFN